MAIAAYLAALQSSPDGATFTSIPGLTSADLGIKNAELGTTAIGGGGAAARIHGLSQWSAKLQGSFVNANVGQSNFLMNNEGNRCDVKAFYSDGTGFTVQGIVEGYDIDINVDGLVTFSAAINANAAPVQTNSALVTPTDTPLAAAIAGYSGVMKIVGATTAFAGEACTLVSGKTYQITNAAHRVIDPTVAVVVQDNGVTVVTANIASIDYLFGKVTFASTYTVVGAITFLSGSWLALLSIAESTSFKLSFKNKLIPKTSWDSAGVKQYLKGIKELTGTFRTLTPVTTDIDPGAGTTRLSDAINNRAKILYEFNLGVGNTLRAWVVPDIGVKWAPEAVTEQSINFSSTAQNQSRDEASFLWGA
jgi:hypothetical protein